METNHKGTHKPANKQLITANNNNLKDFPYTIVSSPVFTSIAIRISTFFAETTKLTMKIIPNYVK